MHSSFRGQMCLPLETAGEPTNQWNQHSSIQTPNKSHMALERNNHKELLDDQEDLLLRCMLTEYKDWIFKYLFSVNWAIPPAFCSLSRTWHQFWSHLAEDADSVEPLQACRWQHNEWDWSDRSGLLLRHTGALFNDGESPVWFCLQLNHYHCITCTDVRFKTCVYFLILVDSGR